VSTSLSVKAVLDAYYEERKFLGFDTEVAPIPREELVEQLVAEGYERGSERDTLPVVGMLAYPPDLSDVDLSDLDDVPDDPSEGTHEAGFYDLRLTRSVLEFYVVFHGARRLSEAFMRVTFDEFVDFARTGPPGGALGTVEITEEWCRNILASYDEHLEYAVDIAENGYATNDEVDPSEVFDGRVKEWVLGVVEEWKEESFPFKEPE
jgi:hypothetical protein